VSTPDTAAPPADTPSVDEKVKHEIDKRLTFAISATT
jgi:hypothetical protein